MVRTLGIDLGLNSIKIACIQKGEPVIITDRSGGGEVPAFVGFGKNGELLVGQAARNRWLVHPGLIVYSPVAFLGRQANDVMLSRVVHHYGNHLVVAQDGSIAFKLGEFSYTPLEIATLLLVGIKQLAEQQTQLKFDQCVISIPTHFGERQVVAVKTAAKMAGFSAQQVINQPTAVALSFGLNWENPTDNKFILIYSLGASLDASILLFKQGRFTVLNSIGNTAIGGDGFTEKLALALEAQSGKPPAEPVALQKFKQQLWVAAEDAKVVLSKAATTEISLPGLDGQEQEIDRAFLEQLIRPELEIIPKELRTLLQGARLTPDLVDFVLPFGGSSIIPLAGEMVASLFKGKKGSGLAHIRNAAAFGAAIQSTMDSSLDCIACGKPNPANLETCQHCGQSFVAASSRMCPRCSMPNEVSRLQCWKCGTTFAQNKEPASPSLKKPSMVGSTGVPAVANATVLPDALISEFPLLGLPKTVENYFIVIDPEHQVPFVRENDQTWQVGPQQVELHSTWRAVLWVQPAGGGPAAWVGTMSMRSSDLQSNRAGRMEARIQAGGRLQIQLFTPNPQAWHVHFWQGQRGRLEMKMSQDQSQRASADRLPPVAAGTPCNYSGCAHSAQRVCLLCGNAYCSAHTISAEGKFGQICINCGTKLAHQLLSAAVKSNNLTAALAPVTALEQQPAAAPVANLLKGLIHAQQGNFNDSAVFLEPLVEGAGGDVGLRQKVSRLMLARATQKATRQDLAGAAQDISKAVSLDHSLKTHPAAQSLSNWQALSEFNAGNLPAAIQVWEEEWQKRPTDLGLMHNLAVAYYRLASECEQHELDNGKPDSQNSTEAAWKKVIALWSVISYSQSFWEAWVPPRIALSQVEVPPEEIDQIQKMVEETLTRDLRDYEDEWNKKGKTNKPQQFHNLDVVWGLERATAKILGDLALEYRVSGWPRGFTCGPGMLEIWGAHPGMKSVVLALRKALPNFGGKSGEQLRKYLSPMGRFHYLVEMKMLDQAISELEAAQAWPEAKALLGTAQALKGAELLQMEDLSSALPLLEKAKANGTDVKPHVNSLVELSIRFSKENLDRLNNSSDQKDVYAAFSPGVQFLERVYALTGAEPRLCTELGASVSLQARLALRAERLDEAEKLARRACQLDPQNEQLKKSGSVTLFNIAVKLEEKNPDRAIYYIQQSLAFHNTEEDRKDACNFLYVLALKAVDQKKRQASVQYMVEAIKNDPSATAPANPTEAKRRIRNYFKSQAVEAIKADEERRAIELLKEGQNYGEDAELLFFMGISYGNLGLLNEAVQILSEAYRLDSSDADVRKAYHSSLRNRGIHSGNQESYDAAIRDLTLALQIQNDADTRTALAQCYVNRGVDKANAGNRYGAISDIDQALKIDPYNYKYRTLRNQLD